MPFTKRTAKAAARKRWKANAQPDYGTSSKLPTASAREGIELAPELPITIDALAGGMPRWEDIVYDLDAEAYRRMRVCYPIVNAVRKLAVRTTKMNWTIVGEGPRAEAAKEIFGQIKGWGKFVEWLTWAWVEGVRFYQIKTSEAREGSSQPWKVPDFTMGGRLKKNAGGALVWDGGVGPGSLRVEQMTTSIVDQPPQDLPLDQFVIHRPGGGSNPEGDLWLGATLYNTVGKAHPRAITAGDLYMRLFGIPALMVGVKADKARPDRISAMLEARAEKARQLFDSEGKAKAGGFTNDETVRLLQADAQGLNGIVTWLRYLESLPMDLLSFGVLTSSAGIADAQRTGDTRQHADEGDDAAFANGVEIAETFNRYVKPWIDARNKETMPPLETAPLAEDSEDAGEDNEAKPQAGHDWYLWPKNPSEGDEQDVDVEAEGSDEEPATPEEREANMALIALRQIVQRSKRG